MASGKQTDVAIMDFSKAFDKVDHQRLILKLKRMGINNKTSYDCLGGSLWRKQLYVLILY
jgi:hypothetical protein